MKKLFSFIMIALMSVMTLNAENTRIYCKMAQDWWKVDNAAVGCHSWGNPGPGTTWPGVRMTPVEGETDLWYIDLDVTKVQNVIFTRVNPSGNIADWGAQTKDLTIPTNGNNLFTITTATATWGGNPGCDGTWSKYEVPVPATPTVTEISITGDKYVGTELTFAAKVAGFSADPDIIYEVKAGKGDYEQAQGGKYTPAAAGDYTVKATASYQPEGGKTEEASKEVAFTVTEAPKVGIVVNVTVPTGTPACYFYGDMSGNQFVAMTKVDATHYTIEFPTATTIGWGYKFVWENGNWATNNSDPAGDIKIEPKDGVINVEIKAWATNPGTEYKYTTYTEWQVKFGPKWEFINMDKQQDGTFTVTATWGNTGINIQSGENPIKKDWYPLNDAALTVDKDVVEGEQVTITLTVVDDENVSLHVSKGAAPQPVETKYYAKNNWNGAAAQDWSWLEMKKEEDLYVLDSVVFGGTGVNINTKEDDTDAIWFDLKGMTYVGEDTIQALDTVRFELAISKEDTVLTAIKLGRPAPAARKEFVFVAGEAADSNPALFAITWGKDGSNETVKLANKADDIYTAEILETVDSLVLVRCATGATEIIWDGEGKNVWNQTANYELCDTMYFESWVEETNLFAVTCEAPQPVETKYYAKNNWNGAASEDWSWLEMKKEEDLYVLDSVVFGGTGVNINTKEDDTDAIWFDLKGMTYVGEDTIQALDTVRFELAISKEDTVLTAIKLGRPAPAARKEFVFVAGEAAASDPALFAITWGKDGSNETVKLANKADDIYTAEILETVDSVVLVRCATGATEIIWDGEGKNVWNQTANYELCDTMYFESWVEETNLFAVTCEAPKPVETKYYAKNNWNNGDWAWLEMTKEEDLYVLDSVVFGGTGVNINTKEDDTDAKWFDLKKMKYNEQDTIQALDTVRFELAISDKDTVLTAILLGRPAPAARKEFVFVAGEAAASDPALFAITWGKDGSNETVKLANKADDIYTAEILETVDSLVLVRCATGATEIIWDGEGKNVWNQTANYELCDTMYFESWVEETNLFAVTCEAPKPVEPKYYITGNAALVGEEKAWQADAIEMVDYTYTFPMLAAGEYQLKVTDGTWEHAWGYDNLSPTVAVEGLYTDVDGNICFTVYTPNDVTVTFAQGYVVVTGDFKNPQPADEGFGIILSDETTIKGQKNEKQLDFLEYIIEANLTTGATFQLYDFGSKVPWTEANVDEASTPNVIINTDNVYEVKADGKYTIYLKMYGPENNQVYIAYDGTGTALEAIMLNGGLKKFMLDGQMYILRNNHLYNAAGNLLK